MKGFYWDPCPQCPPGSKRVFFHATGFVLSKAIEYVVYRYLVGSKLRVFRFGSCSVFSLGIIGRGCRD